MSSLLPLLPGNRRDFERWKRRQIQLLGIAAATILVLGFVLPVDWILYGFLLALGVFGGLFGALEVKKVLVFRRDLHERRNIQSREAGDA